MAGLVSPSGLSNDLTLLDNIDSDSVVDILDKRFQTASPYTYIGEVVVSINPYRQLNIYGNDVINEYRGREMWEKQPHIFALAESVHQTIKVILDFSLVFSQQYNSSDKERMPA